MDYKIILSKMEKVFLNLGFKSFLVNGIKFMRYQDYFCKITFLKDWSAFVIESADTVRDAEKGILEDGDLYYMDIPENQLLSQLESDLIRDYFTD